MKKFYSQKDQLRMLFSRSLFLVLLVICIVSCCVPAMSSYVYDMEFELESDEAYNGLAVKKTYSFTYNSKDWNIVVKIPKSKYDEYTNMLDSSSGDLYVQSQRAYDYSECVADVVDQFKKQNGKLTDKELIDVISYFVQDQIAYAYDEQVYGKEDYFAYPEQVLINGAGDCDCQTVLLVSLLNHAGYNSVLVYVENHIFAAVSTSEYDIFLDLITWKVKSLDDEYYAIESTAVRPVGDIVTDQYVKFIQRYDVIGEGYVEKYENGKFIDKIYV